MRPKPHRAAEAAPTQWLDVVHKVAGAGVVDKQAGGGRVLGVTTGNNVTAINRNRERRVR
jgi:hypothetical protein